MKNKIINTYNYEPGNSMPNFAAPEKLRKDSTGFELPPIETKSFLKVFDCYIGRPEYSVFYDTETGKAKIHNLTRGFVGTIKH